MKKTLSLFFVISTFFSAIAQQQTISVFKEVLFYDGYSTLEKLADEMVPVPDGVLRHKTSIYATKLSTEQLNLFGNEINMEVVIKAACDNYDRLGHVYLVLFPKGTETYNTDEVDKYELGRFITPFMNKNKQPDTVPYSFSVDYLKHIFRDKQLLEVYDFWMELEVFGVPYAANEQVSGCAGRNDVFYGTLQFKTSNPIPEQEGSVLIPLFNKHKFNNYQENATDELGKTVKSITFDLDKDCPNSKLVLITSNHGAATGGEEYIRRWHYVYYDDNKVLEYKPGRNSCEPFRKYNTQGNGIYGYSKRSDSEWQSFSNWCPGDIIDTRIIELGEVKAGTHKFQIEVPDAQFNGKDGDFPLSLYFLSSITPTNSLQTIKRDDLIVYPNPIENTIKIELDIEPQSIIIYNSTGQKAMELFSCNENKIDVSRLPTGIYWLTCIDTNMQNYTQKIIKK